MSKAIIMISAMIGSQMRWLRLESLWESKVQSRKSKVDAVKLWGCPLWVGYKTALIDLYSSQTARGAYNHPHPNGSALRAFMNDLSQKQDSK